MPTFRLIRSALRLLGACALTLYGVNAEVQAKDKQFDAATEATIHQIETSLIPPVIVTNEPIEQRTLAARMQATRVPAVSVAFIRNGELEWARGFGVAKLGGPAVTTETLFQAASISKPVTAFAVMRLVQQGKLDLDTDVNRYLKSWQVPANQFTEQTKVTLRLLLSHSAGVTVHGFSGYEVGAPLPSMVDMLQGKPPANNAAIVVDLPPGTKVRYSGGGYLIIQQLLEDVTEIPFAELMSELVLKPVGMTHSTFEQPLPASQLQDVAIPYRQNGVAVKSGPHIYPEMAPAGLWTTPTDLARLAIEMQRALAGKSKLLSAATAKEMLTPPLQGSSLGFQVGGGDQRPYFGHDGGNEGYRCSMLAFRNGDGIVTMTNGDAGSEINNELRRTIAFRDNWPTEFKPAAYQLTKVDTERFADYVGAYQLNATTSIAVTRETNRLFAQSRGPRSELFPFADGAFFTKSTPTEFRFVRVAPDQPFVLRVKQFGNEVTAKPLDEEKSKAVLELLAAMNKKVGDQSPTPGGEKALRRLLEELAAGKPDYSSMTAMAAMNLRPQAPHLRESLTQAGAVQSVTFKGIGPAGGDIFDVKFANGGAEVRIVILLDGKIDGISYQEN